MRLRFSVLLLLFSMTAGAADSVTLSDAEAQRYRQLANELRCLVCQNQSIADSNAPLARDLKQQLRRKIAAGESDEAIRSYMQSRYGDFVLYATPVNAATMLLWFGPALLLMLALALMAWRLYANRHRPEDASDIAIDEDEQDAR